MPKWEVHLPIQGDQVLQVEADSEEEAIDRAMESDIVYPEFVEDHKAFAVNLDPEPEEGDDAD